MKTISLGRISKVLLLTVIGALLGFEAFAQAPQAGCCLVLPVYPSNKVSLELTAYYGYPNNSSLLTAKVLTGPVPSSPPLYAAWCVDANANLDVQQHGTFTPFDGLLFSSCDPNLNDKLGQTNPGVYHSPTSYVSPAVWKQVNYILNHRDFTQPPYSGPVDGYSYAYYWDVQESINVLVGGSLTVHYDAVHSGVTNALLSAAATYAPAWQPACGDKMAAIAYLDATLWYDPFDDPQLIIIEVPCVCPPVCDVIGSTNICAGQSQNFSVTVSGGTPPYTIAWTGPGGFNSTNATITVSIAGTYTVTITDSTVPYPQSTSCSGFLKVTTTPPMFDNCPTNLNLGCNPNTNSIPSCNNPVIVTAHDNYGSVTVNCTGMTDQDNGCVKTRTLTYTANNVCGNATCVQKVTWTVDTNKPAITFVPPGGDLGCNPTNLPTDLNVKALVTATDDCGATTNDVSHVDTTNGCGMRRTFTVFVTDGCGNVSDSKTIVYTWTTDNAKPTVMVSGGGNLGCNPANVPNDSTVRTMVTATDNCSVLSTNVTHVDTSNGCSITRTFTITATDGCGNISDAKMVVYNWTADTTKPSITCPAPLSVQCIGDIPAPDLSAVAASDGCSTPRKSFVGDSYLTNGCVIIVTRIYKATDACGNSNTCTQTITVSDTTKPVITTVPTGGDLGCTPASLPTDASVKALVAAMDNCGMPTINVSHILGGNACSSNLTFTITAIDGCRNVSDARTVVYTFGCPPCVPSTFNFQGSSALSGTNGNTRTFSTNGVSIKVTAFSRTKPGGSWATAYLGSYGGGLGVTDSSEGDGSNNRHTVDNIDRDNYVLFEFSEPVVLSRATLGYVVSDSDLTLWIGTFADPYNNHLTLSDAVLGSFGYTEDNLTGSTTARTADLNATGVMGNAIVIAAWPGDATPEDQFKIALFDICKPSCAPAPCTGSICGSVVRDCDASGNLSGDTGIPNVTVTLKKNGTNVTSTVTGTNGDYCFGNLVAATYTVVVTPPTSYSLTTPSGCNHQQTVTLTACQSKTGITFGYTGTAPGIYFKKTGPATAVCGQTITYTFAVTNTGNTCFYGGMHVDDPMLGGRIFYQTPVSPGQGFTFTSNYVVKATDPTNLVNTATATGHPPTGNAVSAQSSWTVKVTPCTPCTGSICGAVLRDCDANANVSGEAGIAGVTVQLKNSSGTVVATNMTDANGNYCFNNRTAGTYTVVVTPPANYTLTTPASCNHQQTVTLAACQNKASINFGYTGTAPGISFRKTGPANAVVGQTITYTFSVTNTGNTCFYGGLHVDDPMLGGRIFYQTPVSPGQGFSFTSNYVVKASDPANLVNTATATGHPPTGNAVSAQSSWTVKVTSPTNPLPSPWVARDIGNVAATGSASYSAGKFSVNGSGADIWDTADAFRYVYRSVTGNFTIVTRVATVQNTNPWAKAGVMVRESLDAGSKNGGLFVTPGNGVVGQSRNTTGGITYSGTLASSTAPYWIKIVRSGNSFTGYYSANGTTWSATGSQTLTTVPTVYIGLAVTSHNDGTSCTATFDNVAVTLSTSSHTQSEQ